MLRLFTGILLVATVCSGAPNPLRTLSREYSFAAPVVDASGEAARVRVADCALLRKSGEPALPFRTAKILLPPGASIIAVTAESSALAVRIALTKPPEIGSEAVARVAADSTAGDMPDYISYGAAGIFPSGRAELLSVQKMNGYRIAIIRLFPVRYDPLSGELLYTPELMLRVETENAGVQPRALSMLRAGEPRIDAIADFVDNPEAIGEYAGMSALGEAPHEEFDYLLVTSAALTNAFAALVEQKRANSLRVKVALIEEVVSEFPGVDDAEKLRNYIIEAYHNWNIRFLLLGGDVGIVPHRGAYGKANSVTVDEEIPTDLYFACLDGSWNGNGNDIWGEPDDGEDGGEIDMLAELYVGRAPVSTPAEVTNFVSKTILYETADHPNPSKAVFMAEFLGTASGAHYSQGGNAMDISLPHFVEYEPEWLDDRPGIEKGWQNRDAVRILNKSPHIVSHYGHADNDVAMRIYTGGLVSLTNGFPFLLYGAGCNSGAFDDASAFGSAILKGSSAGAFAVLMNSRLGIYATNMEWLFSGEFMEKFFDELLVKGHRNIGVANQLAKHGMLGSLEKSGSMPYRWCYFSMNLLGDPHTFFQGGNDLRVSPDDAIRFEGYEGESFASQKATIALENNAFAPLPWTLALTSSWLNVSSGGGTLPARGGSGALLSVNSLADSFSPGTYSDTLVLSNRVNRKTLERGVTLLVKPIPGVVGLEDSIAPYNDYLMHFGEVVIGLERCEQTTVFNSDPDFDLIVESIELRGSDGSAVVDTGFSVPDAPPLPHSLAPGERLDVNVLFAPRHSGEERLRLVVGSSDRHSPQVWLSLIANGVPDSLRVTPADDFVATGGAGGPFAPLSQAYTLSNAGNRPLAWEASLRDAPWVDVSPSGGTLMVGQSGQVLISLNSEANSLGAGGYVGEIAFSNTFSTVSQSRELSLEVIPRRLSHFIWGPIESAQYEDEPFAVRIYALDNLGALFTAFSGSVSLVYGDAFRGLETPLQGALAAWKFPLSVYSRYTRTQVIYKKADLGQAGDIHGLSLYVGRRPSVPLRNLTIRLQHTELANYHGTQNWETNGWQIVSQGDVAIAGTGWLNLEFSEPFSYDGNRNLMVDFSVDGTGTSFSDGFYYAVATEEKRSLYTQTDVNHGSVLNWTGTSPGGLTKDPLVPLARFDKRLGDVAPEMIAEFVDGVWEGEITLSGTGSGAVLYALGPGGAAGESEPFSVLAGASGGNSVLPLEWLLRFGLRTDGADDFADTDGDGFSNWEEWVAGTDPTDAGYYLHLTAIEPVPGAGTRLRWQSVSGRYYYLESSEALPPAGSFAPFATNIAGEAGGTEYLDARSPAPERFYRVGVEGAP